MTEMDPNLDGKTVDSTFVTNILEDFDAFVGGKKRKLNEDAKSEEGKSVGSQKTPLMALDSKSYPQVKSSEELAAQVRIIQLETEVQALQKESKKARFEQELELITNYPKSVNLQLEIDDLKLKYQTAKDKIEETEKARRTIENDWKQHSSGWKREKLQLQSELTEAKHAARAASSQLDFLNQQREIEVTAQELKYSELEHRYEEQVELADKANRRIEDELTPALSKLEASEEKCKKLTRELQMNEDDAKIVNYTKAKLLKLIESEKKYLQVQGDNEMLRERCKEFEMMREKAIDFEAKYTRSESRLKELSSLRADNAQLKQTLQKWEKFDSPTFTHMGFGSPDTMIRKYCDMQQQLLLLTEKSGSLQAVLSGTEVQLDAARRELVETRSELETEKANLKIKTEQCQKLERKLVYIKMDRDSFPKLIESYDKTGFSRSPCDAQLIARVERSEQNLSRAQERIKELEGELDSVQSVRDSTAMEMTECSAQISTLNLELQSKANSLARVTNKLDWLEQQNRQLTQENIKLESELTTKSQELKQISSTEIALTPEQGPQQVWVHFKDNKLTRAREEKARELAQLRSENVDLKEAIDKGEFASRDMVHRCEVDKLEERLRQADVMESRLKESFSKRITEFREVCNILTGYRIDAQAGGKYKIRSIYAENADDFLEFTMSQGNLSLHPTAYSNRIKHKIDLYLGQHSSFPSLISDITMELFKKQTLMLD